MKSSSFSSSYTPSFSSVSSSSSLNSSTVESFQFSPCQEHHRCCMGDAGGDCWSPYGIPFKVEEHRHQDSGSSQSEISEVFSSDESEGSRRKKQTLGELMSLHTRSDSHEEEELLLLDSKIPQQKKLSGRPPKPLLVQALCGSRKSSSSAAPLPVLAPTSPRLQRSNASTRRRCSTPSPLRNSESSTGASACCGGARKSNVINHVVNCTVVRSRSSGNIPQHGGHKFLTKSKSVGASVQAPPSPKSSFASRRSVSSSIQRNPSTRSSLPANPSLFGSRSRPSTSTYNSSNQFSSGRRSSFPYTKSSSVSSSSSGSLLNAIDRYHQHKNTEAEHKRRSSFLPYKSALLSLFFPLPSFWSHQPTVHHHTIRGTIT